jgi:hypothetical protein
MNVIDSKLCAKAIGKIKRDLREHAKRMFANRIKALQNTVEFITAGDEGKQMQAVKIANLTIEPAFMITKRHYKEDGALSVYLREFMIEYAVKQFPIKPSVKLSL